ncbi:MAG: sulfurtransferase TusA family protein [Candidatus Schekmanbacteria bacterium]|nr:sulfurtransferase TusA family protein [Candidatus Schekmanbacteria bacterium]
MNPKRKGKKDLLITDTIDITKDTCPITFVKTKLKLESLSEGDVLEVFLKEGEPVKNVPRSVQEEGHKVLTLEPHNGDIYRLVIQKQ